jgi:hypothetical protein
MCDRFGSPVHPRVPGSFFIIFVDRIFTTFIRSAFTNVLDAKREMLSTYCL